MNRPPCSASPLTPHNARPRFVGIARYVTCGALSLSAMVTMLGDSKYVIQGITGGLPGWKAKGWKAAGGKSVANKEL
ncbi:hypothetical protein [Methylobacterium sp. CM6247]